MTVRKLYVGRQLLEVSGAGYEPRGEFSRDGATRRAAPSSLEQLLRAAALASDAQLVAQRDRRDSWHVAGRSDRRRAGRGGRQGRPAQARTSTREFPRVDEIPFTSETKRMTTLHRDAGRRRSPTPRARRK